jgi:hypothetical protein
MHYGQQGDWKKTLGKFIRKTGLGPIRRKDIAVIDDDCMSVNILFFFRRKYVNICHGVDELQPFLRFCKKKKLRFYVKTNPESRITQADILLKVNIAPQKRKERLIRRYGDPKGTIIFNQTQSYINHSKIRFHYQLTTGLQ